MYFKIVIWIITQVGYDASMPIDLLMTRYGEDAPVLPHSLPENAASAAFVERQTAIDGVMRDDSRDPQNLAHQGWGLVVSDNHPRTEELLAILSPLKHARAEQQGREVTVYRVPAGLNAERSAQWLRDVYWNPDIPRETRPRYLLILGDLDSVSLEFQQIVGATVFIGRVAFSTIEEYSTYVQKVLRWENQPSHLTSGRALFFTAQDGSRATSTGKRLLMAPLLDSCRENQNKGLVAPADLISLPYEYGQTDPRTPLLTALSDEHPSLFFSLSHGLGPPRGGFDSPEERRALQGALCFDSGKFLRGDDLLGKTFLPGGIWFMVACFGGATPASSSYYRWLKVLRQHCAYREAAEIVLEGLPRPGEPPFIAALPRAALANPRGPLAVVAHADLAWSCAFDDLGATRSRADRFTGVVNGVLKSNRIGTAFHDLYRFFSETNTELTTRYDADAPPSERDWIVERSRLWMLRNDLAGYLLLGDPAVRLPLAGTAPLKIEKKVDNAATAAKARRFIMMGPTPNTSEVRSALDDGARERAVIAILSGETLQSVANRLQVPVAEVQRWTNAYRDAGRLALRQFR